MALDDVGEMPTTRTMNVTEVNGFRVGELLGFFAFEHLAHPFAREISARFATLAVRLCDEMEYGEEFVAGLRKLLEAKDCAVRQAVLMMRQGQDPGSQLEPVIIHDQDRTAG